MKRKKKVEYGAVELDYAPSQYCLVRVPVILFGERLIEISEPIVPLLLMKYLV